MENKPSRGNIYALKDLYLLDLDDTPCLVFSINGDECVLQTSHITDNELLSVPNITSTKWCYTHTTFELIPVFVYSGCNNAPITDFIDCVPNKDTTGDGIWWCTPKGHPRDQEV